MTVDKIRVSGDPRVEFKSATVNGRKYCQYHQSVTPRSMSMHSPKHRPSASDL